jgi:hypothetical protein
MRQSTAPRRLRWPALLAVAALLAACLGGLTLVRVATAQTPPAPTEPPATSEPNPTSAPQSTAVPTSQNEDDEEEPPPAPPVVTVDVGTVAPEATRTRRPTRTPATTATTTPTPVVAGALRLTLSALPAEGPDGQMALRVLLANRDLLPAVDTTLEIRFPDSLELADPRADMGQVLPGSAVLHWYIPQLEPGAAAELLLPLASGPTTPSEATVCVLLLSAASPLEHCAALQLTAGPGAPTSGPAATEAAPLESEPLSPEPAPASALPWGWGLLLAGLGALGIWLGLRLRGGRPEDEA